tara:strand:+ start:308 stop:490 length:183 start_codon:yes stop_codon:yes gene_type:complete
MTYNQTQNLFEAMDNLETYAKLYQREMDKDDADWNEVHRYGNLIKVSRKRIFDVMEAPHD